MIQIDIARLLLNRAGFSLAEAQTAHVANNEQIESECAIQAVILFQAAIEAIVNEEIFNHPLLETVKKEEEELNKRLKSLSFKNKWKKVYDALQIKEQEYLDNYLHFYSHFRVPITHPKSRYISIEKYSYKHVYEGLENGWFTVQLLYAILGKELTSWKEFCKQSGIRTLFTNK